LASLATGFRYLFAALRKIALSTATAVVLIALAGSLARLVTLFVALLTSLTMHRDAGPATD
jgi:ATP-dependent protease HslVU (ClpYQ) peptidase subunit